MRIDFYKNDLQTPTVMFSLAICGFCVFGLGLDLNDDERTLAICVLNGVCEIDFTGR